MKIRCTKCGELYEVGDTVIRMICDECQQKRKQKFFEAWQIMMFGKVINSLMEEDCTGPNGVGYELSDRRIKYLVDGENVTDKVYVKGVSDN